MEHSPKVSIGMPVLNGEAHIARALKDLLAQTFTDFEIVVCDNSSDDRTCDIVRAHAKSDDRIRLLEFDERVDILHSFKRAFDHTCAPFFMFAPADDRWYPEFIEEALAVLEPSKTIAACTGKVAFTSGNRFSHIETDTYPVAGSVRTRINMYLLDPGRNSRAFSLYRRNALVGAFPDAEYPGWDFQMIARSLVHGDHYEIPRVLAERDITPYSTYLGQIDRLAKYRWEKVFPLARLALSVWRDPSIPKSAGLAGSLIKLTLRSHWNYSSRRLPNWYAILKRTPGLARLVKLPDHEERTKRTSGIGTIKHPPLAR